MSSGFKSHGSGAQFAKFRTYKVWVSSSWGGASSCNLAATVQDSRMRGNKRQAVIRSEATKATHCEGRPGSGSPWPCARNLSARASQSRPTWTRLALCGVSFLRNSCVGSVWARDARATEQTSNSGIVCVISRRSCRASEEPRQGFQLRCNAQILPSAGCVALTE